MSAPLVVGWTDAQFLAYCRRQAAADAWPLFNPEQVARLEELAGEKVPSRKTRGPGTSIDSPVYLEVYAPHIQAAVKVAAERQKERV